MKYEGIGNTQYASEQAPKNAGEYRITFSVKDTDQQYAGTVAKTFTIAKKGVTVTAKDKSISAGQQIPSLEQAVEGTDYVIEGLLSTDKLEGQARLAYADESGEPVTPELGKAGTYKILISGFESSNYEMQYQAGTLTITGVSDNKPDKPQVPEKPGTSGSYERSIISISQNGVSAIEVNVEKNAAGTVTSAIAEIYASESADVRETVIKGNRSYELISDAGM